MLLGHLALPFILRTYRPQLAPTPLYAASIFPDVVDKALKMAGLRPNGRTFSHSLIGLVATTSLVTLMGGKQAGHSWLVGYSGHFLCDLEGTMPLFYPFVTYRFRLSPYTYRQKLKRLITDPEPVETALTLWALVLLVWRISNRAITAKGATTTPFRGRA